jgi:hypothetical protein
MPKAIQVFLAHASEDKERLRRLHKDLAEAGFKPWLDEIDLLPGQNWQVEIQRAIRESDIVLACLSKASVQKQGYVQKEFRLALAACSERPPGKVFLIPVKLDSCEVPRIQIPDLALDMAQIQWVDLGREDGLERLMTAIRSVAEVYHPPGTETHRQEALTACKFEVNPKYAKRRRWAALADVLVDLRSAELSGSAFLIPSGAAPQSLRHTEVLRNSADALELKRAATVQFIRENQDRELDGKWFRMRTRSGEEMVTVYCAAYDLFLNGYARRRAPC